MLSNFNLNVTRNDACIGEFSMNKATTRNKKWTTIKFLSEFNVSTPRPNKNSPKMHFFAAIKLQKLYYWSMLGIHFKVKFWSKDFKLLDFQLHSVWYSLSPDTILTDSTYCIQNTQKNWSKFKDGIRPRNTA